MWSKKPTPVVTSERPEPSRSSSTWTWTPWSHDPRSPCGSCCRPSWRPVTEVRARPECCHLRAASDGDPQPAVAGLPHQDPALEQPRAHARAGREGPEQREVRSLSATAEARRAEPAHRRVTLGTRSVDRAGSTAARAQPARGRPGSPPKVAGPTTRSASQTSAAAARYPTRAPTGRRPCSSCGDDEVGSRQLQARWACLPDELGVRLVDDQQPVDELVAQGGDRPPVARRGARAVVLGDGRRRRVVARTGPARPRAVGVEGVVPTVPHLPAGVGVDGRYSGYIEYAGASLSASRPGPPKAWSSWTHHLVGAVRGPDLRRLDAVPEVGRQGLAQAANSRSG